MENDDVEPAGGVVYFVTMRQVHIGKKIEH